MYKVTYTADGNMTEFLFSFPFFQPADIKIALNDKVISQGWSVAPNERFDGGVIVFEEAPITNTKIDIFRQISLSRNIDYQPTDKIDPEHLNQDFNFLLEAFKDLKKVDVDLSEWENIHDNTIKLIEYTRQLIEDKLTGGSVLGVYQNLISVLDSALPKLVNDYGFVTEPADVELNDDYGLL